jgi:two-component system response regulator AtoC
LVPENELKPPNGHGEVAAPFTRAQLDGLPPESVIFGRSEVMAEIRQNLRNVADAEIPVLIEGESGTGKEIIAKLIHRRSPLQSGPFVKVNCPAIPGTLIESELFGYEKGAFTGAYGSKPGRVELAEGGTLFLDEIAELDFALQAKLLQLLQDGQFFAIGGRAEKQVRVRVLCATNQPLENAIEAGTFRQDLFYRVNVVSFHLPPLRERREDIVGIVEYFLQFYGEQLRRQVTPLSGKALRMLETYLWPGNIRELENLVKRYVVLDSEDMIIRDLQQREKTNPVLSVLAKPSSSLKEAVRDLENKLILNALEANQWNRKLAARALKISYRQLLYKVKEARITVQSFSELERPNRMASD